MVSSNDSTGQVPVRLFLHVYYKKKKIKKKDIGLTLDFTVRRQRKRLSVRANNNDARPYWQS